MLSFEVFAGYDEAGTRCVLYQEYAYVGGQGA
jgi:hypothetical protein